MLTTTVKVTRELERLEKLEKKTLGSIERIKAILGDNPRETLSKMPPPFKKTWGRGRKIPAEIKLEILSLLKSGEKPKNIRHLMNISLPSIQKIKDEAGMVKRRRMFA